MFKLNLVVLTASVAFWLPAIASAVTTVTVEKAGVQETSAKLEYSTFENFDAFKPSDYEGLKAEFGGGKVTGSYDMVGIREAGEFGGAGGEGNYLSVEKAATLALTEFPANYFGLWASAINGSETISFFRQEKLVDEIALSSLKLSKEYFGNPTKAFFGTNPDETYAFINFFVRGGYDRVFFSQTEGGRFESDVHTVGIYDEVAIIPEPATWMTMMMGLAMIGVSGRRKRGVYSPVVSRRSTT